MDYREKIDKCIFEIEDTVEDIVIIGDNSIGKTDILYKYLEKKIKTDIYFIDSYNKIFNTSNLYLEKIEIPLPEPSDVVAERLDNKNFNLKDTFGNSSPKIEFYYLFFKEKLDILLLEFLNIKLNFKIRGQGQHGASIQLDINGENYDKLSNGYQAIIRLFLELLYAEEFKIKEIVIDEINEFLSPKNEERIFPFIKEKFPHMRFIVTTHSSELIASAVKGKLLILEENYVEVQRLEYFETPGDIRKIHLKMFNKESKDIKTFESIVRELLMKKRMGKLLKKDLEELEKIDENSLNYTYKKILNKLKDDLKE